MEAKGEIRIFFFSIKLNITASNPSLLSETVLAKGSLLTKNSNKSGGRDYGLIFFLANSAQEYVLAHHIYYIVVLFSIVDTDLYLERYYLYIYLADDNIIQTKVLKKVFELFAR